MVKKPLTVSTKSLIKYMKQSGNKQINDDVKVTVPVYKSKKVAITIVNAKSTDRKLLMISAKRAIEKNMQDMSLTKKWIRNTGG